MAPFKASGIDGLHVGFYQKMWNLVGNFLCKYVLDFINSGSLPKGSNVAILVLIPKVKHPKLISKYAL